MQCLRRCLAERLNDIRENYGVPVSTVRLELTEQGTLNSAGFKQVGLLKNMGFDLALDDYGTGFSNASRMKDIPFEEIKIDMSLVRGHFAHPDSYLPNLIQSMHRMGFKVVAEGVETKEMVDGLKRMGCDYFQGFLLFKARQHAGFPEEVQSEGREKGSVYSKRKGLRRDGKIWKCIRRNPFG